MKRTILSAAIVLAALSCSATAGVVSPMSGWAVVQSDGSLVRGASTTGALHLGAGIYEVDFLTAVNKCVFIATIGLPGSTGNNDPGTVTVVGRGNNINGVYVTTFNEQGVPTDLGFHLNVRC